MPKIGALNIGDTIRSNRHGHRTMQIVSDNGNSFRCHEILSVDSGKITINQARYYFIDKHIEVEKVSV